MGRLYLGLFVNILNKNGPFESFKKNYQFSKNLDKSISLPDEFYVKCSDRTANCEYSDQTAP